MTNLEWLKKNLSDEEKENDEFCYTIYQKLNGKNCDIISCDDCYFNKYENVLNFLLEEHKETIKLKQWEYDYLDVIVRLGHANSPFSSIDTIERMKERGYYKGVKDEDETEPLWIILKTCEIVSDDYEGFEECK